MIDIQRQEHEDIIYWKMGRSYFGKPKMYVNCFLIDGLLIDTGQPNIGKYLLPVLNKEQIDSIIVTHHHEDHSGNIEAIKKQHQVLAYASKKCCEIMTNPPKVELARLVTWGQQSAAKIISLSTTQMLQTTNYSFEIIHTPGHAIDQISLFEANKGWLFSGDIYVNDYVKIFMRDENIYQQIDSIQKLLQLEFDALLCNHQPVLKNGKKRLQAKLQFLENFVGRVTDAYLLDSSIPAIMEQLNLRENYFIKAFSMGQLSTRNMIKSVIEGIPK